jgi:hypothetical protein
VAQRERTTHAQYMAQQKHFMSALKAAKAAPSENAPPPGYAPAYAYAAHGAAAHNNNGSSGGSGGTRDGASELSSSFQPMVPLSSDATTSHSAADLTGTTMSEMQHPQGKSRSRTDGHAAATAEEEEMETDGSDAGVGDVAEAPKPSLKERLQGAYAAPEPSPAETVALTELGSGSSES